LLFCSRTEAKKASHLINLLSSDARYDVRTFFSDEEVNNYNASKETAESHVVDRFLVRPGKVTLDSREWGHTTSPCFCAREDLLSMMMARQIDLQKRLYDGRVPPTATVDGGVDYAKDMVLALLDEVHEILRELPWKPWKSSDTPVDTDKLKEEIVDAWHFLLNITVFTGDMTQLDLAKRFAGKNEVNHKRQDEGY
jgi:dimeric dUTPase (all-alpha-NTP-PPase superfamily)